MSAPAKRVSGRVSALPEPELISLVDDPAGPYVDSPEGWWTEYGGTRDEVSGVIAFPPNSLPACSFPCSLCDAKREGA
jgi:hypothetical protein